MNDQIRGAIAGFGALIGGVGLFKFLGALATQLDGLHRAFSFLLAFLACGLCLAASILIWRKHPCGL